MHEGSPSPEQMGVSSPESEHKSPYEDAESKSIMEQLRRLHRSSLGRAAELAGAIGLSIGVVAGVEFSRGKWSRERSWEAIRDKDPIVERVDDRHLEDIPTEQRDGILKGRDTQFRVQLEDGIQAYQDELDNSSIPADSASRVVERLQQQLETFRPSLYDQEFAKLGLPVIIDHPYPVIRFRSLPAKGSQPEHRGEMKSAGSGGLASLDTILVDPEAADPASVLRHEDLHARHAHVEDNPIVRSVHKLGRVMSHARNLDEGATELMRRQLDQRLGIDAVDDIGDYRANQVGVDFIAQTVGEERFWKLYWNGQDQRVMAEFDEKRGKEASIMLMSDEYGMRILQPQPDLDGTRTVEAARRLDKHGLFLPYDASRAKREFGVDVESLSNQWCRDREGKIVAQVLADGYGLNVSLDREHGGFSIVDFPMAPDFQETNTHRSVRNFPKLAQSWHSYRKAMISVGEDLPQRDRLTKEFRANMLRHIEEGLEPR